MRIYIYLARISLKFNQLLSKLEKKIKKNPFFNNAYENSNHIIFKRLFFLWMKKKIGC